MAGLVEAKALGVEPGEGLVACGAHDVGVQLADGLEVGGADLTVVQQVDGAGGVCISPARPKERQLRPRQPAL